MPLPAHNNANAPIDPALVAEVVRRVIARLNDGAGAGREEQSKPAGGGEQAETAAERVISAAVVARVAGKTKRLNIHPRAVVTPAARDEAKRHSIALARGGNVAAASGSLRGTRSGSPEPAAAPRSELSAPITDAEQPERAEAIAAQLARRGVVGDAAIVLSDRPAAEVHRRSAAGERAAMVRCLADVDRFGAELRPQVWVLDMIELNWIAAVNVAARIVQTGGASR